MNLLTDAQSAELARLAGMADADIDTRDIPERTDWSGAQRGRFYRPLKRAVTIRLDADLIEWFKARGGRYQSAINQALREYVERHRGDGEPPA